MVQNPQFLINIRKNINANNPGYGKYYPKAYVRHVYHIIRSVSNTRNTSFFYCKKSIQSSLFRLSRNGIFIRLYCI